MQSSEAYKVIDLLTVEQPSFADSIVAEAQHRGVSLVEYIDSLSPGASPEDRANCREAFLLLINATNLSQDTVN
jgi:hypothetical protein